MLAGLGGVLVVLIVVWVVASMLGTMPVTPPPPTTTATPTADPQDPVPGGPVPAVQDLTGEVAGGKVTFTWRNPEPHDGDVYLWRLDEAGAEHEYQMVEEPRVVVGRAESGRTCIEVMIRRENGRAPDRPAVGCAP